MWSCIEAAVSQLSVQEFNSLEQTACSRGLLLEFNGFDGTKESAYLAATRFLIEDLDRYISMKEKKPKFSFPIFRSIKSNVKCIWRIHVSTDRRNFSFCSVGAHIRSTITMWSRNLVFLALDGAGPSGIDSH